MAEFKPLKLTGLGGGEGKLEEFADGDTVPSSMLGANLTAFAGLTGAADKLQYFTGAGALSLATLTAKARTLLASADEPTMRAFLGLGTAAQATLTTGVSDSSIGRAMRIGDHGFAATSITVITQTQLDDWTFGVNGQTYRATSPTGLPLGTYLLRINKSAGANNVYQELVPMNVHQVRYERVMNSATGVVAWNAVYSSNNLIGAVSQVAGVPTGAAIERGSGAGGRYTKWADGTLEAWKYATTLACTADADISDTWIIPATFVDTEFVVEVTLRQALTTDAFTVRKLQAAAATTSTAAIRVQFSETQSYSVSYRAIGRWY